MVEPVASIDVDVVRERVADVQRRIDASVERAGRQSGSVELVAAVKYVPVDLVGLLAEAGIRILGENRAQDLSEKQERWGGSFEWDFIGDLQSRKVASLIGRTRLIHSVGSRSALAKLDRPEAADQRILLQVNVSGEETKSGISESELPEFLELAPCPVVGLMTMPPWSSEPEESRKYFAQLRSLAERHGLAELSMGTSQDYEVAVEEGATIVRIGSVLYG